MTEERTSLSIRQSFFKRLIDMVLAALLIVCLLPLLLVIAVITKITSRGKIIYRQERIGLHAKPFTIYKFRSMYTNAELNGPELSFTNDKRITAWGKIMRQWKLDELPQLWNILKGDMSFVGPRPERKYFIDLINKQAITGYNQLLTIKPGLTSAGMVNFGYASSVDEMIARMQFDLAYAKQPSLQKDFKIILQTIGIIITGKGK